MRTVGIIGEYFPVRRGERVRPVKLIRRWMFGEARRADHAGGPFALTVKVTSAEGPRFSFFYLAGKRLDDAVDRLQLRHFCLAHGDVIPASIGDAALHQMHPVLVTEHPGGIAELADLATHGFGIAPAVRQAVTAEVARVIDDRSPGWRRPPRRRGPRHSSCGPVRHPGRWG